MIIGFGHRSRVGKDTAGQFLENHLRSILPSGVVVKRTGFAYKLKEVASDLFGVPDRMYYENNPEARLEKLEGYDFDIVELWVQLGNKMREIDPKVWLNRTLETKADILIVTDVRFPNEAEEILARGGKVYKIHNSRVPKRDTVSDAALDDWDKWSGHIMNSGSIERLLGLMEGMAGVLVRELYHAED